MKLLEKRMCHNSNFDPAKMTKHLSKLGQPEVCRLARLESKQLCKSIFWQPLLNPYSDEEDDSDEEDTVSPSSSKQISTERLSSPAAAHSPCADFHQKAVSPTMSGLKQTNRSRLSSTDSASCSDAATTRNRKYRPNRARTRSKTLSESTNDISITSVTGSDTSAASPALERLPSISAVQDENARSPSPQLNSNTSMKITKSHLSSDSSTSSSSTDSELDIILNRTRRKTRRSTQKNSSSESESFDKKSVGKSSAIDDTSDKTPRIDTGKRSCKLFSEHFSSFIIPFITA